MSQGRSGHRLLEGPPALAYGRPAPGQAGATDRRLPDSAEDYPRPGHWLWRMAVRTRPAADNVPSLGSYSRVRGCPCAYGARWRGFGPRAVPGGPQAASACAARVRAAGVGRATLRAICRPPVPACGCSPVNAAYCVAGFSDKVANAGGRSPRIRGAAAMQQVADWLEKLGLGQVRQAICRERHQLFRPARSHGSRPQRHWRVARSSTPVLREIANLDKTAAAPPAAPRWHHPRSPPHRSHLSQRLLASAGHVTVILRPCGIRPASPRNWTLKSGAISSGPMWMRASTAITEMGGTVARKTLVTA